MDQLKSNDWLCKNRTCALWASSLMTSLGVLEFALSRPLIYIIAWRNFSPSSSGKARSVFRSHLAISVEKKIQGTSTADQSADTALGSRPARHSSFVDGLGRDPFPSPKAAICFTFLPGPSDFFLMRSSSRSSHSTGPGQHVQQRGVTYLRG